MKTLIRMICLGVLAAALPGPSPAWAISAQAFDNAWNLCRLETTRTERRMAIPRHLLTAISLAESGRRDDANGVNVAWPWTVTSGGQGRFFDTKAEALAEVEILMTQGVRNIDVGCMQVNLFYHAGAFKTLDEAFDPRANTTYAATYLKSMHAATGDWTDAAGYYHSTTPQRNGPYKEKVLTFWRRQGGGPGGATAVAARTPGTKAKLFIRIDHDRMARLNARFKARRDAQRIGDQPDRMAEGDFHQREPVFGRDAHAFAQDRQVRFGGDAIFAQHRVDDALVGRVDHCRPALVVGQLADPRVDDFGDEDVHPVGRAIDMRIDPGEFFLELVGAEPRRTEHAEAPRLADCGNDIAAVTEGE